VTDAVGHWLNAAGRVPLLSAAEEVHLSQAIRRWQDWEGGPDAAGRVCNIAAMLRWHGLGGWGDAGFGCLLGALQKAYR
jgi:hypothetical protein